MIKPICYKCRTEIDETGGAVLISPPPYRDITMPYCQVFKFHICRTCYDKIFNLINQYDIQPKENCRDSVR